MAAPATAGTSDMMGTAASVIGFLLLAAAALLARRHFRMGRADRTGAFRTAAIVFLCQTMGWLLRARHYASIDVEETRLTEIVGLTLVSSVVVWLLYLAFEPYLRRFWPELLIGWTRLLSGRVRDPFVGRDVLVGAAAGTIAGLIVTSREVVPHLLGRALTTPALPPAIILLGSRYALAFALEIVLRAFRIALDCACIVVFLRILVRRTWLVLLLSVVVILPIALAGQPVSEQPAIEVTAALVGVGLVLAVLLRFGLLSLVVMFYTFLTMELFPPTTDWSRPYAGASAVLLLAIAAVSAYGFYASRGDEPLFGRALLD
jgi:serine/threonine-protein kinase